MPQLPAEAASVSLWARRKWWILGAVGLVLVAAVLAFFLTRPADTPVQFTTKKSQAKAAQLGVAPTLVEGSVEYSLTGKTWQALTDKVNLKAGNEVRTSSDGRVVLTLDDGSAIRLGSNSAVTLKSLDVKNVRLENTAGEVYNRVITSATRTYTVAVDGVDMVAKGTAFRTKNTADAKGVEVFQSTVQVESVNVPEGKAFFTASSDAAKKDKISDLDLNALKGDAFLKWNVEQDKQMTEAKDKLGVLVDIDKPALTPVPAPTTTQTQANGIVLSGSLSGYSGKFSWKVTGVDTSKGFKLVRSASTKTPVYPGDSAQFISSSAARSTSLDLDGGKTYYFRVCAYRGDSCDSYSNTVTLTTPPKESGGGSTITPGAVTLNISGSTLSWTLAGTAPNGFKVVVSKTQNPTYPENYKHYTSATSYDLAGASLESGLNYVRVCKYTGDGCTDYSNQVTYTKP